MLRLYMTSHASDYNVQSYLVKQCIHSFKLDNKLTNNNKKRLKITKG